MGVFRGLSLALVAVALMLLGADVVSTLEKKVLVLRSLAQVLSLFGADSDAWMKARLGPDAAQFGAMVLSWPGWLSLGVIGLALAWAVPGKPLSPPPELPPPPPYPR